MNAETRVGPLEHIRPDSTLTGSYVASNVVDLQDFNSVVIRAKIGTGQAVTANLKFEWGQIGDDGVIVWSFEQELIDGIVAGGEVPQTTADRRVDLDMTNAGNIYTERFARESRYFRVKSKSSGITTGTLSIDAQQLIN